MIFLDEERKMMSFLKEIPVKYYQKARVKETEDKVKKGKEEKDQVSSEIKVEDMKASHRNNKSTTERSSPQKYPKLIRASTFKTEDSQIQDTSFDERWPKGSDITKREQNLFFSPLNKYVNSPSISKIPTGTFEMSPSFDEKNSGSPSKQPISTRRRGDETSIWVTKVGEITQNITDYLEKDTSQLE